MPLFDVHTLKSWASWDKTENPDTMAKYVMEMEHDAIADVSDALNPHSQKGFRSGSNQTIQFETQVFYFYFSLII